MVIKYLNILWLGLVLRGCVLVSDPMPNDHLGPDGPDPYVQVVYEYPCSDVEPYNYNPIYCDSDWDYECCTWYIGWGCREQWCWSIDSCGWEFIDDYCVY